MHMLVLQLLCLLSGNGEARSTSESEANNPVFNLDHTALEKNIAAIFNKVAHSSATTKRSVPAYEAQISQSTVHTTTPSSSIASLTTSLILYPMILPQATNSPIFHELPSYAPPSRALFTPPLPPEYANPFADKPTLRGTNIETHPNTRRPVPPPSLTPTQERIPIKPPDLIEDVSKTSKKQIMRGNKVHDSTNEDSFSISENEKDVNDTIEFVPSLHFNSISRILSGSNGRKQDIPEILLKPIPTKLPNNQKPSSKEISSTLIVTRSSHAVYQTSTSPSIAELLNNGSRRKSALDDNYHGAPKDSKELYRVQNIDIVDSDQLPNPQHKPSSVPSKIPSEDTTTPLEAHPLQSTWKVAWSFHIYSTATMFTFSALYSVYKIVRFDDANNFLTQSYFLTIHLSLTVICTLRCFYLFYDAYNLANSLPETVSDIFKFLPLSLLAATFAILILYMSRSSTIPSLYQNKCLSPAVFIPAFIIYVTLCFSLHVFSDVLGFRDKSRILPLINRCIYIIICVILGLCYMYIYRVIRSQLQVASTKSIGNHVTTDITPTTIRTAVATTFATALLFILMAFVQLYGIFGVQEHVQPYTWLWWGWEFTVRLIELAMCGLIAWVASLSHYQLREKKMQQHAVHSGFALFPCGNSLSTENMDDALYPAICSTNQAIQNYTLRTGKQVYDDSFPLNTLPDHINVSNTFERHVSKKQDTLSHFSQDMQDSFSQDGLNQTNDEKLNRKRNLTHQNQHEYSAASGSTMLVAEDGFVRFRNLGHEEDEFSDPQSIIESNHDRENSITCSDRFESRSGIIEHLTQDCHQNSVSHLHLSLHRQHHQIYNNT